MKRVGLLTRTLHTCESWLIVADKARDLVVVVRETIVNRTYGTHKNQYIFLFLLTIFGPIYYSPLL